MIEPILAGVGIGHLEETKLTVGQALQEGEWIEFETNPFGAFPKTHVTPGIRPLSALPQNFKLSNWEGKSYNSVRAYRSEDETFAGRRRTHEDYSFTATQRAAPRFADAGLIAGSRRRLDSTGGITYYADLSLIHI